MKKKYVNLEVQVVDVQLNDCIAGSAPVVSVKDGLSENNEVDGTVGGNANVTFSSWGN